MSSSSRRGGALAAILIGLAVVLGLILVAAVSAGLYLANHVRIEQAHGKTTVETPFGSLRVRRDARIGASGIPVYPGAARDDDSRRLAGVEIDMAAADGGEIRVIAAHYTTADPVEKVAGFYREKLPEWTMAASEERPGRGGECRFEFRGHGFRRVVAIHAEGGLTRIALASVGEPAAN